MIKFTVVLAVILGLFNSDTDDKKEVIKTLTHETEAFCNKEFELWESFWFQEQTSYKSYFRNQQFIEYDGWKEIRKFAEDYFSENPNPESIPEESKDYEITIRDNLAWVKYQVKDSVRGNKKEYRRLIKIDGEWKISYMSTVYK